MIEECLLPPYVLRDGEEVRNEPLSVFREFDFPAPVGRLRLCNVDHEEAQRMPLYLTGKGLKNAAFFIALDERFVAALQVFKTLGLNRRQPVEFHGSMISPIQFVASRFPRLRRSGRQAARCRLRGDAVRRHYRRPACAALHVPDYLARCVVREGGVQGTGFQTGASAACAVAQFARAEIARRGVFPAEGARPRGGRRRDGARGPARGGNRPALRLTLPAPSRPASGRLGR